MAHPPFRRRIGIPELNGPYSVIQTTSVAGNTTAGFRVSSSGTLERRNGSTYTVEHTWLPAGASAADYDFRVTSITGTSPSGSAVNTWLNAGTSREWNVADGIVDGVEVFSSFSLEISLAGNATAFDSTSVDLTSERT